jgi:polyisoprenoid-binding protein YceI
MNFKNLIIASAAFLVFAVGCTPKGDNAATGEAQEVANANESAVTYSLNTTESMVTWNGYKPSGKHNGTISITEGSISVENGAISAGSFQIDVTSLAVLDIPAADENNGKLKGHLMSPDFFAADSFPTASFEVVSVIAFEGDSTVVSKEEFATDFTPSSSKDILVANPTHMITGNLTMRGTTKSISIPASVSISETGLSAVANFNIDRTEWDLSYGDEATAVDKAKDKFIYNTVTIGFSITASPEVAAATKETM